ncbi:hypothetical protein DRV85_14050 [Rhodosalinus halophilus]|uniref:UspA domain-containing protein n=2 Tax=Rhodosalinus halophilus TaxID=2259333 RepID=A0A365U5S3_9RHOB|nr:hypothetical protein DRV85_14050 [Rhodosalinus halophilus]
MSIASVLVPYRGGASSDAALGLALALCRRHGARLTGLLAHGRSDASRHFPAWLSQSARKTLIEAIATRGQEIAARFARRVEACEDIACEWIEAEGDPNRLAGGLARYFDITVLGVEEHEPLQELALDGGMLALASGRPLIVVPPSDGMPSRHDLGRPALVAWDGGRAAARALRDALPLLRDSARADVLTIVTGRNVAPANESVSAVGYLARHGIEARQHDREAGRAPVATQILHAAEEFGAGYVVMGAFQHPKLAEELLGGVTERILRETRLPVLMSH